MKTAINMVSTPLVLLVLVGSALLLIACTEANPTYIYGAQEQVGGESAVAPGGKMPRADGGGKKGPPGGKVGPPGGKKGLPTCARDSDCPTPPGPALTCNAQGKCVPEKRK